MKVGVLTWYKAINHGAILQTYASCKVLETMEVSPVVLDYTWNLEEKINNKDRMVRRIKNFSMKKLLWYIKVKNLLAEKNARFNKFILEYLPVGNDYSKELNLDAVYIGSDMVFDISEGYNPYMYGIGVNVTNVFSYAASFGYTTFQKLSQHEHFNEIIGALKNFKAIGYRDQNTFNILKEAGVSVPMYETIDPVLAYGFEKEINNWDSGKWKEKKYILIYAYDSTMNDEETVTQIRKLANEENLEIISCGYYHKWCDQSIPASPVEFVEMFKHAEYILTDTFHGTVFSLIMHKNFASIIRKNAFKVKYLLEATNLDSRISDNENSLIEILHSPIDYTKYDKWIKEERQKSKAFIKNNLNLVSN